MTKKDDPDGESQYVLKCKGIHLNSEVAKQLSFDTFKEEVRKYSWYGGKRNEDIRVPNELIRPNKFGEIFTYKGTKRWTPKITKGNLNIPGDRVYPFGYYNKNDHRTRAMEAAFKAEHFPDKREAPDSVISLYCNLDDTTLKYNLF